jgi:hypothetical protein
MTGSNQYDIYATPRPDNKDDGRCDNIFHINFSSNVDSYKPDSTYSILKPNNIRLEYNYNYNTDYQFIGKFAEDYFATSSNYIIDIPITTENGKYILGDNSLIARKNDQYIFKSFPNKKYIINKDISGSYLNGIYNSEHLQTIINNKYTPSDLLYNFKSNIKNINDKSTKNSNYLII